MTDRITHIKDVSASINEAQKVVDIYEEGGTNLKEMIKKIRDTVDWSLVDETFLIALCCRMETYCKGGWEDD